MKNLEKAKIILEELDETGPIQINWNLEEMYIKSIVKALDKIDKIEKTP